MTYFLHLVFGTALLALVASAQIVAPIRNKLSAGDLKSAESILEVYEKEKGRDANYLDGLVWVTRGAVLLGEWERAALWDSQLGTVLEEKLQGAPDLEKESALAGALGARLEAHAQILAHDNGRKAAVAYLDQQLARYSAPIGLRSRLYKRRNQLALVGSVAPPIVVEEALTPNPPALVDLQGKPVVIFGWAQWCGDCRSQVAALGRIRKQFGERVHFVTLTRFYEADKAAEKALINKVWSESYQPLEGMPIIVSTASMERYGVSSTPTFVILNKKGKVTHYLPYRLTEPALSTILESLLR